MIPDMDLKQVNPSSHSFNLYKENQFMSIASAVLLQDCFGDIFLPGLFLENI